MKKSVPFFAVVISGLALTGLGCNPFANVQEKIGESIVERAIEGATGGQVDVDVNKGIAIKDEKTGETAAWGANVTLPSNFPSDLQKYPEGELVTASTQERGKKGSFMQSIEGVEGATVLAWYDKDLTGKGYKLINETTIGYTFREYEKGEVKITIMIISQQDEDTGKIGTTLTASYEDRT